MSIIINQSIKGILFSYIGTFIGFFTTFFIITKFLTPEEFGLTSILLEVATIISSFASLGTISSTIRFFPYFKTEDNKNKGFAFYLICIVSLGAMIFFSIFLIFKGAIVSYFSDKSNLFEEYVNWIIPLSCFFLYLGTFEIYANAYMKIYIPKVIREIVVRILLIIVYILYAFKLISFSLFVTSFVSVYGIAMAIMFFYTKSISHLSLKRSRDKISSLVKKDFIKYTIITIIGSLGYGIVAKIDLFMVGGKMGLDYAGIFRIAYFMAIIVEIPTRSISAIASPLAATVMKNNDVAAIKKLYNKVSINQLLAGALIFIFLWVNIDFIYYIIPNGEIYVLGKSVVFFMAFGKLIEVSLIFGDKVLGYSKYYQYELAFTILVVILTITSNMLLIPILGITGAAISSGITVLLVQLGRLFLIYRKIKITPFNLKYVYLYVFIIVIIIINFLIPNLSNLFLNSIIKTFIVFSIFIPVCYKLKISEEFNSIIDNSIKKINNIVRR